MIKFAVYAIRVAYITAHIKISGWKCTDTFFVAHLVVLLY